MKTNHTHSGVHKPIVALMIALSFGPVLQAPAQDTARSPMPSGVRIFFTGHSFHMFVPKLMDKVVVAAGIDGHKLVGVQGIGGSRTIQHWDKPDAENKAKAALKTGEVDVFTMAPHVLIPDEGITNFVALGLQNNPQMRFYVQASWFPFDVPDAEKRIRDNSRRDTMQIPELQAAVDGWRSKLEAQIDELNKKHGRTAVFIVSAGDAVVRLRERIIAGKFPGITKQSELFRDPIGHGLAHVTALVTYCNYAAIYRTSPVGLKVGFPDIDAAQDKVLQEIAWETVSNYKYAGVK